jgi:hypothetical protein
MNGQWIGGYAGTNNGALIIEVDETETAFEGAVCAIDSNEASPTVFGEFTVAKGGNEFRTRIDLAALERGTGSLYSKDMFQSKFPSVTAPKYADTAWIVNGDQLSLMWKTDIGTEATGTALKSQAAQPSNLTTKLLSWDQFKSYATALPSARYLFRGQENSRWKRRTTFHRSGRANMAKFMRQDVAALYSHLAGLITHRLNLNDSFDYAALLALVQHHGYPTPLLDWTLSPFVASYFAFNSITSKNKCCDGENVRVHVFDALLWNQSVQRSAALHPGHLHLTVLKPLSLNNPRLLPQQAFSLVTNVDDLEAYIVQFESPSKSYLTAIDIPQSERRTVFRELALMGIGAGSLFPGLDGACSQLKEQFFEF